MISSQERQKVVKSQYTALLTPTRKRYATQSKKVLLLTSFLQLLDISCIPSSSPDFSTFLDPPIQSFCYFDPFAPLQKSKLKSKCYQITKPMDSIHVQLVF